MKTIEYRVRPVTRYIVTRWERSEPDHNESRCCAGSETFGEFVNERSAQKVANALGSDELSRSSPGETVSFPPPPAPIRMVSI